MNAAERLSALNTAIHSPPQSDAPYRGPVYVGVDLGTAYIVLVVLDAEKRPLAGAYQFAQVVRDGLVVDYMGAVDIVRDLKTRVERQLGFELTNAATGYPPGVPRADIRACENVLYGAGFLECTALIDEPSAANAVLNIQNGAVVDVGGGTTGVAVIKDGEVVYTADEPTGGTHFSLVIAGANDISFGAAEDRKKDPTNHAQLFPVVRPVMEKVATIVGTHIAPHQVEALYLVGGTCSFTGIDRVVAEVTGVETHIPPYPMFVTPLGIAMNN